MVLRDTQCRAALGWPVFIPFFGAMIALKEPPRTETSKQPLRLAVRYGAP